MAKEVVIKSLDGFDVGGLGLENYDVILFGEVHQVPWVVELERLILLNSGDLGFVGMEHFNYDMDILVAKWLSGCIDWDVFIEEYRKGPEGFDLNYYKPLLEAVREMGLELKGLMPPRNIASRVAKEGLHVLSEVGEVYASEEEVIKNYPGYREAIESMVPKAGPMARLNLDGIVNAQAYKDTVMAKRIYSFYKRFGRCVAYMGYAHCELPGSVTTRLRDLGVENILVLSTRTDREALSNVGSEADIVFYMD